MSQGFNHFDENGNAVMVDVSGKNVTYRTAVATGEIHVGEAIMEAVKECEKGRCAWSSACSRNYGSEKDF